MNEASVENFVKYLDTIKLAKRGLKEEKRKGFEKYCESLNPDMPYDIMCKNVKRLKKRFLVEDEFFFRLMKFSIIMN